MAAVMRMNMVILRQRCRHGLSFAPEGVCYGRHIGRTNMDIMSSVRPLSTNEQTGTNTDKSKKKPGKIRQIIAQYGKLGLGLYAVSYLGTLIPAYIVFRLNHNFGMDPLHVLEYFNLKEKVTNWFG